MRYMSYMATQKYAYNFYRIVPIKLSISLAVFPFIVLFINTFGRLPNDVSLTTDSCVLALFLPFITVGFNSLCFSHSRIGSPRQNIEMTDRYDGPNWRLLLLNYRSKRKDRSGRTGKALLWIGGKRGIQREWDTLAIQADAALAKPASCTKLATCLVAYCQRCVNYSLSQLFRKNF